MSQFALRWILMFDAVTCAIPGGKRAGQVAENCAAAELPALTEEAMAAIRKIYDERIHGNSWVSVGKPAGGTACPTVLRYILPA